MFHKCNISTKVYVCYTSVTYLQKITSAHISATYPQKTTPAPLV